MISPTPGRNTSTWPVVSRSASGTTRGDQVVNGPLLAAALVANLHRKRPAFGVDDRAIAQQFCDGLGGQRGAHHHDPQIGPQRLANSHEHSQREVHLDRALVELIEHDGADVFEGDVVEQPAQQDARRHDDEPRVAAHARVEADLVADFVAQVAAAKLRDPPGDGPGRQAARLNEHHLLAGRQIVEHGRRHEHRLARARRGRDDDRAAARRGHDFVEHAGDGQIRGGRSAWKSVARRGDALTPAPLPAGGEL